MKEHEPNSKKPVYVDLIHQQYTIFSVV